MKSLRELCGAKYAVNQTDLVNPDIWSEEVSCKDNIVLYLYSLDPVTLALYVPDRKLAGKIASKFVGVRLDLLDEEGVIYFTPDLIKEVLDVVGIKKAVKGEKKPALEGYL